ncbi:hypothetical protein SCHPADRAFT_948264, partial [Schizopora paradoxa]
PLPQPRVDDNGVPFRKPKALSAVPVPLVHRPPPPTPVVWSQSDGYIYVGFKTSKFHVPPRPYERGALRFEEYSQLEWERPGFPYLAYLPASDTVPLHGPLTSRLNISPQRLPTTEIVLKGKVHVQVKERLINSWTRFERNMFAIADILQASSGYKFVNFPVVFRPDAACLRYPYPPDELNDLVRSALDIRKRFIILCALVSFLVSLRMRTGWYEINNVEGKWMQFQGDVICGGVHPVWSAMLLDSVICSRDMRRRGVIIDYPKTTFTFLVPYLLQFNMPVVLRVNEKTMNAPLDVRLESRIISMTRALGYILGTEEQAKKQIYEALRKYLPPPFFIAQARRQARIEVPASRSLTIDPNEGSFNEPSVPPPSPLSGGPSTSTVGAPSAPPPSTSSFPTRAEFFAQRDRENEELRKKMSPKDLQRVENRRKQHLNFPIPGAHNNKTQVYVWEWTEDRSRECRNKANVGDFDLIWEVHKTSEMRYDPFRDQYD